MMMIAFSCLLNRNSHMFWIIHIPPQHWKSFVNYPSQSSRSINRCSIHIHAESVGLWSLRGSRAQIEIPSSRQRRDEVSVSDERRKQLECPQNMKKVVFHKIVRWIFGEQSVWMVLRFLYLFAGDGLYKADHLVVVPPGTTWRASDGRIASSSQMLLEHPHGGHWLVHTFSAKGKNVLDSFVTREFISVVFWCNRSVKALGQNDAISVSSSILWTNLIQWLNRESGILKMKCDSQRIDWQLSECECLEVVSVQ